MKNLTNKFKSIMGLTIGVILVLSACTTPQSQPTPAPVSTDSSQADMPNPASVFCEQQGGKLEIRSAADGSQSGVCIFPDGSECDEWAYFRGECAPGGYIPTPIQPVQPTPTSPTILLPSDVVVQTVFIPAGVIVNPHTIQNSVTDSLAFYTADGLLLGEMSAPYADKLHVAGSYQGSLDFPLVFHSFDTESRVQSLKINKDGQVADILSLNERSILSNLVGVPREPIILYAVFQPMEATLQTQFFLGTVDLLPTTAPILTLESTESRYWKPIAIRMKAGAPKGIWFTREPWGIGGEIVFAYQEGLSYLDLASGTIYEALNANTTFSSLSQDQTWIAYSARGEGGPSLFIHNLSILGEPLLIPSLPESDRGAGDGIFSPSNKYIAWREAQGSLSDGSFHETIRIATLDGQVIGNFKDETFYKTAKLNTGTGIKPVGWLNDEILLVQVITLEKPHEGTVVKLNIKTGELTLFAQGFFAGWFYP
jgi:putative hemolysin